MGRAGRPTVAIELTDEKRETLVRWSRRHSSSQALALRSRIVLACADGRPNTKIADELGCDSVAVGRWRHRFAAENARTAEVTTPCSTCSRLVARPACKPS